MFPTAAAPRYRRRIFGTRPVTITGDRIDVEIEPDRVQSYPLTEDRAATVAAIVAVTPAGYKPTIDRMAKVATIVKSSGWSPSFNWRVETIDGRAVIMGTATL